MNGFIELQSHANRKTSKMRLSRQMEKKHLWVSHRIEHGNGVHMRLIVAHRTTDSIRFQSQNIFELPSNAVCVWCV